MDPYVGEIRPFGGKQCPADWHFCDGSVLPITGYELLYSLIGTTYGGNGTSTFALPNLQASVPIGQGQGTGLSPRTIGTSGGQQSVEITAAQLPSHSHTFTASTVATGNVNVPSTAAYLGQVTISGGVDPVGYIPQSATGISLSPLYPSVISTDGGSVAHVNEMPFLVINYMISLQGLYPQFN